MPTGFFIKDSSTLIVTYPHFFSQLYVCTIFWLLYVAQIAQDL